MIVMAFTSNMISCGLNKIIRYMVPCFKAILTTTGAIEEDIIKIKHDFYIIDTLGFEHGKNKYEGEFLRKYGYNRIGNLAVHNECYVFLRSICTRCIVN